MAERLRDERGRFVSANGKPFDREKWFEEHREEVRDRSRRSYWEHREEKLEHARSYRIENREKILARNKEYYRRKRKKWIETGEIHELRKKWSITQRDRMRRLRRAWSQGISGRKVWKKAELVVKDRVLPQLGFYDVFNLNHEFYAFDYLAKKNGKTYAIEVTTSPTRQIRAYPLKLAKYLELKIMLIFVRPNLKEYIAMELPENRKYMSVKIEEVKQIV